MSYSVEGWLRNSVRHEQKQLRAKAARVRKRYQGLIYADAAEFLARRYEQAAIDSALCPYAGGLYENGRLVGRHSEDCMCEFDGCIR